MSFVHTKSGGRLAVRCIRRLRQDAENSWTATTDDDERIPLNVNDGTARFLGATIIPAHPDEVLYSVGVSKKDGTAFREQYRVLAWAFIVGEKEPTPLTVEGWDLIEVDDHLTTWVVRHPDGRFDDTVTGAFTSLDDVEAELRKQLAEEKLRSERPTRWDQQEPGEQS